MKLPTITESMIQTGLMLAAGAAGALNGWGHVLDLATEHGQAGWHAWSVAACIETAALSAGLELRRRRHLGQPLRLVEAILVAAVALQLAAQLAQAEATAWGRIVAAVPTLTFLTLAKLALVRSTESVETTSIESTDRVDPDRVDPIESTDPIEHSIGSTDPVDPIEADTSPESIDRLDPIEATRSIDQLDRLDSIDPLDSIDRAGRRSLDDLRAEFDRLVALDQLAADSPIETTRKALRCSPDRARIILGRKAA